MMNIVNGKLTKQKRSRPFNLKRFIFVTPGIGNLSFFIHLFLIYLLFCSKIDIIKIDFAMCYAI
jgi:hypothetical protein